MEIVSNACGHLPCLCVWKVKQTLSADVVLAQHKWPKEWPLVG